MLRFDRLAAAEGARGARTGEIDSAADSVERIANRVGLNVRVFQPRPALQQSRNRTLAASAQGSG